MPGGWGGFGAVPFQPIATAGMGQKCQFHRLPGCDTDLLMVGMQVQFAGFVTDDVKLNRISFDHAQHALRDRHLALAEVQFKALFGGRLCPGGGQGAKQTQPQPHGSGPSTGPGTHWMAAFMFAILRAEPVNSRMCMPVLARSTM